MNTAILLFAAFRHSLRNACARARVNTGRLSAAVLLGLSVVAGAQSGSVLAAEHTLEGSWIVYVTPAAESGIPPFVNLGTFTRDGRNVNSDPVEGAAVGEWIKLGSRQFAVTFMGFTNVGGDFLLNKVRGTLDVNEAGDTFTGPFRAEVFNSDGTVAFGFEGTVRATRFSVERL